MFSRLSLIAALVAQMAAPSAPKPDTIESLRATVAQKDQQIRELSNEVVRLRIELKTQSAAAHDLAEQIVRAEIARDQKAQQDAAAAKAAPPPKGQTP
jgi:TolA-binding protein